jgi:hypothetical protein
MNPNVSHIIIILFIIVLGTTGWAFWTVIQKARHNGGWFVAKKHDEQMYHRKCKHCNGMAVVMLDGSIIPEHIRTIIDLGDQGIIQEGKIANTKSCEYCRGMGRVWVSDDGVRRDPIQDRKVTDSWQ